jgi:hypothetical protein
MNASFQIDCEYVSWYMSSRKSVLLSQARRRVGVKSPRKKLALQTEVDTQQIMTCGAVMHVA